MPISAPHLIGPLARPVHPCRRCGGVGPAYRDDMAGATRGAGGSPGREPKKNRQGKKGRNWKRRTAGKVVACGGTRARCEARTGAAFIARIAIRRPRAVQPTGLWAHWYGGRHGRRSGGRTDVRAAEPHRQTRRRTNRGTPRPARPLLNERRRRSPSLNNVWPSPGKRARLASQVAGSFPFCMFVWTSDAHRHRPVRAPAPRGCSIRRRWWHVQSRRS